MAARGWSPLVPPRYSAGGAPGSWLLPGYWLLATGYWQQTGGVIVFRWRPGLPAAYPRYRAGVGRVWVGFGPGAFRIKI